MLQKPNKLRSALLGGLVIGAISGIPGLNLLNCCCCAGVLIGGALSVYLYKKEFTAEMPPLESSDALILGIISGIIGAAVGTLLGGIITMILGPVETQMLRNFMEKFVEKMEDQGSVPPGTLDNMRSEFENSMAEAGTLGGMLRSMIYSLIIYPIFAMLGGLIGYGIFVRKKNAQIPPMPPVQP